MTPPQDESPFDNLTGKQRAFVLAYVANGFNATQAALDAGYSKLTSYSIGSENLKKPDIKKAIDAFFEENTMGAKEALYLLTQHARGDIGDLWDEESGQIDWDKARKSKKTHLIKRMYHKTTRITRGSGPSAEETEVFEDTIELHDPQKAITLIGKQLGLFIERNETTLKGSLDIKSYQNFSPDEWDTDDTDAPADS